MYGSAARNKCARKHRRFFTVTLTIWCREGEVAVLAALLWLVMPHVVHYWRALEEDAGHGGIWAACQAAGTAGAKNRGLGERVRGRDSWEATE